MPKTKLTSFLSGGLAACLLWNAVLFAQDAKVGPPAPLPSPILTAKRVFIAYAGQENNPNAGEYSGGSSRTYSQFYAAMKTWGHYDLAASPAECDLVFEIRFTDLVAVKDVTNGHSMGQADNPQFRLVIIDPKTHIVMWAFTEYVEAANLQGSRDKNFDKALALIVADVKSLAAAAAAQAQK